MKQSDFLINQLKTIIDQLAIIEKDSTTIKGIKEIKESNNFMSLFDSNYSEVTINERQLSELTDHRFNTWELYHKLLKITYLELNREGQIYYGTPIRELATGSFSYAGYSRRTLALIIDDEKLPACDQCITLRLVGMDIRTHYLVNMHVNDVNTGGMLVADIKTLIPDFTISIDK